MDFPLSYKTFVEVKSLTSSFVSNTSPIDTIVILPWDHVKGTLSYKKMRITICCDWCKLHQQTIAWKFFSNSSNFHRIASSLKFTPNQRVLKKFLKLQLSFCNSRPADHFIGHITFLYLAKLLLKWRPSLTTSFMSNALLQDSHPSNGSLGQRYVVLQKNACRDWCKLNQRRQEC